MTSLISNTNKCGCFNQFWRQLYNHLTQLFIIVSLYVANPFYLILSKRTFIQYPIWNIGNSNAYIFYLTAKLIFIAPHCYVVLINDWDVELHKWHKTIKVLIMILCKLNETSKDNRALFSVVLLLPNLKHIKLETSSHVKNLTIISWKFRILKMMAKLWVWDVRHVS